MSVRFHAALAGTCLLALASTSRADPAWFISVRGQAAAATVGGPYQRYMQIHEDDQFVNPNDFQPLQVPSYSGSVVAHSSGVISYEAGSGRFPSQQTAEGSVSLYASVGGLRSAASGANSMGDYTGPQQFAFGSAAAITTWIDTLTFHTANPLGADFRVSVSLDDNLSTFLQPSAGTTSFYPGQTSSYAQVHTLLSMTAAGGTAFSASDNYLHIEDAANLDADHRDHAGQPTLTLTPPPSRTLSAIVHIFDGTTIRFEQDLTLSAGVNNGNGTASADAGDTAWMNLVALDDGATYSAASGTVFATAGDPFAPGIVAPVPEPSDFALVGAGLGVLAFVGRRRRARERA